MVSQPCSVCGSTHFSEVFSVKDFSITQEVFVLTSCNQCGFLFTSDAPSQSDIGKYYQSDVYISHTDGSKGLIEKLYQLVRKKTLVDKRKLVSGISHKQKGNVLDYGCGTGAFLNEMKISGWQVSGIEPDSGARKRAEQLVGSKIGLPEELSGLTSGQYDVITMWHVLEHVHELSWTIDQLKRLLKEDGRLFIAVPNHHSFDARHYGSFWAAYDVPRHLYHFSPDTMGLLMEKHGLKVIAQKAMWFDSFYVSMLSEKYKNGKINIIKAFCIGLISNFITFFNREKCSSLIYVVSK
jgi:2-polyprenyl-3-methyl-5-hydroxy-6-metoxy-1,4-benzoquinol methylase